jgi:nicotinamidase-related amidase
MLDKAYHVIHMREGHRPDLSDLPAEAGCEIIPHLAPAPVEPIIRQARQGIVLWHGSPSLMLRTRRIRKIMLTGTTTDVCVDTTMREANDPGFECLLTESCCGATDPGNHAVAIRC